MRFCRLLVALLAGGTLATACADISQQPPTPGPRAIFDTTTAVLPLPNDVLKANGFLALPLSDCSKVPPAYLTQCELTNQIEKSLNTLDGWLTSQTLNIPVDSVIDVASLAGNLVLWNITNPAAPKLVDPSTYYVFFNKGISPATKSPYMITLKNKAPDGGGMPVDFPQGSKYFAYVLDGVKDSSGNKLIEAPVNFFFKSKKPLFESVDGGPGQSTVTILSDADAKQLEGGRLQFAPLFAAFEANKIFNRDNVAAFTVFTIQSGPRAIYNPTSVPKQILPTPFDDTVKGKKADAPLDSKPTVLYDMALDKTTLADNAKLFKLTPSGTGYTATQVPTMNVVNPVPGMTVVALTMVPTAGLEKGTLYLAVTGNGIKGEMGTFSASLTTFSTTRYTYPLVTTTTPVKLNSPFLDNTLDVLIFMGKDPVTATKEDWALAYDVGLIPNLQGLELLRQSYSAFYDVAIAQGFNRYAITSLWTFTTAN